MLCTFTTKDGSSLVVRSDDIRTIVDTPSGTQVGYMDGSSLAVFTIQGTAAENRDRILQEELDQIGVVELHRFKTQQLLQAQPTPRGRQSQ